MQSCLINGIAVEDSKHTIAVMDRGLHYGDGLFETLRVANGQLRFWDSHFARLQLGCERLGIALPDQVQLQDEATRVIGATRDAVVKIIVTRGVGGRGYRPANNANTTRIVSLHKLPAASSFDVGIEVRWCTTRLSRNAQLAGIKHLNRLEQVLAQNEWHDDTVAEGLLMDTEGELICATAANLFVVSEGVLVTPDLRFSGIHGVLRGHVLAAAAVLGIDTDERSLWPDELSAASEIFITNAVRGIRPVVKLEDQSWAVGVVARAMAEHLQL